MQPSTSIRDLCSYAILCYHQKHNLAHVTNTFTNALVDMFPAMNINDGRFVDTSTILIKESAEDIDNFFISHVGAKFEEFIHTLLPEDMPYKTELTNSGASTYNRIWFNNSDRFVHPLLSSYQDFKKQKGMPFKNDDIQQIAVDYSLIISYNHYSEIGYLNKDICKDIINTLTDATNDCLQTESLNYDDIEYKVHKDITNPKSIKAAFDFIVQL